MDHHIDFVEHGYCLLWEPELVLTHVLSDILTGLAYYSIAFALFYFAYKRRDLPFLKIFYLFGIFILACGTTHLFGAFTIYVPAYWEEGIVKAFTAIVSVISAILFIPLIPKAIAMPSLTRALEETRESEQKFRTLFDNNTDGLIMADIESRQFMLVNRTICAMLGYSEDELKKLTVADIHPDYAVPQILKDFEKQARKEITSVEVPVKRKDGSVFFAEISASFFTSGGREYLLGAFRDITLRKQIEDALRESEANYRSLVNNVNIGVFRTSTVQDSFLQANPAMVKIFGYDSIEEFKRVNVTALYLDSEYRKFVIAEVKRKGFVKDVEVSLQRKDGTPIWCSITATAQFDETGEFKWIDGVLEDITGWKKAEEEKKHLETQLLNSQKMEALGQLAGGVAHDFNNVLSAIMGYATLSQMTLKDKDPAMEYLNEILVSTNRASDLTRSLLAFSRKQAINVKPINLNDTIRVAGKLLGQLLGEDILLTMALSEQDIVIMADTGQIEQVVINLATNARDAMPGGGTLTLSTQQIEMDAEFIRLHGYGEEGKYALISIEDSGTGIDEQTREKIFEPFFTTKDVGKGTGLGLSIVYGIIKQHHGYVDVYSEVGKGTNFRIYLPSRDLKTADLPAPEYIPLQGGTETVLMVEDEKALRKASRTLLEKYGYTVIEAEDGIDAVNKFREHKDAIALVLMDVIMPRKNGKEAYQEILAIKPDARAIFLSGYMSDEITDKIVAEGWELLSKPVSPKDLFVKIRAMLDKE